MSRLLLSLTRLIILSRYFCAAPGIAPRTRASLLKRNSYCLNYSQKHNFIWRRMETTIPPETNSPSAPEGTNLLDNYKEVQATPTESCVTLTGDEVEEMDILPSQEHQEEKEGVGVTNEKGTEEEAIGGKGEGGPGSKEEVGMDNDVEMQEMSDGIQEEDVEEKNELQRGSLSSEEKEEGDGTQETGVEKKKEKEDLDVTLSSSEEEEEEEGENVPIQEDREEFRPVTQFPSTIEGFGYRFKEDGELRHVETNSRYVFEHQKGERSNSQARYEALGELITEEVYKLLETETKLKRIELPVDAREDEPKSFFFMSEDATTNPDKLLLLIHGSGAVRAGQWARSLIINDNLKSGTQLPYIERGIQEGYGIMVLNTNNNFGESEGRYHPIKGNGSPEEHADYVWEHFIKKSAAKRIDIVAHSFGGVVTVHLVCEHTRTFLEKGGKVAFTDSVHFLDSNRMKKKARSWMIKNSVNWVSSLDELDTPQNYYQNDIPRVSAGTNKHVETSGCAFESVFRYLTKDEKKGKSNTGKKQKLPESSEEHEASNNP